MKIRTGFVSNSSSSSFVPCAMPDCDEEAYDDLCEEHRFIYFVCRICGMVYDQNKTIAESKNFCLSCLSHPPVHRSSCRIVYDTWIQRIQQPNAELSDTDTILITLIKEDNED